MQKLGEHFRLKQDYLNEIAEMSIPKEIKKFLHSPGGHSIILRGEAGAGKTTLALQIIESQSMSDNSLFLSTRVSDYLLLRQFPWLKGGLNDVDIAKWMKENASWFEELEISQEIERREKLMRDGSKQGVGLEKLRRSFNANEKDPVNSNAERLTRLTDLNNVYEEIKRTLPKRSLLVVDSVDALAESYGISNVDLIKLIQSDLVEGYGANVVFVLENNDRAVDYLADASAILETMVHHNRVIRQMRISKLRGCPIEQPIYLYSLNGGRITFFESIKDNGFLNDVAWKKESDQRERISTGWPEMDHLMGGGIERGSVSLIELGNDIPSSFVTFIERSLVSNFASMGRGVLWVPLNHAGVENAHAQISTTLDNQTIDGHVRIYEVAAHSERGSIERFVYSVEGSEISTDLKCKNLAFSLSKSESPTLSLVGFDTLESIYGDKVSQQLGEHLSAIRRNKCVFVGITSPSTKSTKHLSDIATIHLKIENVNGSIIVYFEKPFSKCHALSVENQEEISIARLVPIL